MGMGDFFSQTAEILKILLVARKKKKPANGETACRLSFLAERVGFEPTSPEGLTHFECAPL